MSDELNRALARLERSFEMWEPTSNASLESHWAARDFIAAWNRRAPPEQPVAPSVVEKPEPDAWFRKDRMKAMGDAEKDAWIRVGQPELVEDYTIPLFEYTPRAPLTDAEWQQFMQDFEMSEPAPTFFGMLRDDVIVGTYVDRVRKLCRAIEARIGRGTK